MRWLDIPGQSPMNLLNVWRAAGEHSKQKGFYCSELFLMKMACKLFLGIGKLSIWLGIGLKPGIKIILMIF